VRVGLPYRAEPLALPGAVLPRHQAKVRGDQSRPREARGEALARRRYLSVIRAVLRREGIQVPDGSAGNTSSTSASNRRARSARSTLAPAHRPVGLSTPGLASLGDPSGHAGRPILRWVVWVLLRPYHPCARLETTGAKSGARRQNAIIYFRDGDRVTIVASNAGSPRLPAWYHNLRAHPDVTFGGIAMQR